METGESYSEREKNGRSHKKEIERDFTQRINKEY